MISKQKLNWIELEETDSTNLYLKNIIKEKTVPNGSLVYTKRQTNGIGQRNSSWFHKEGDSLAFTLYLKPDNLKIKNRVLFNFLTSNIIHKEILKYCPKAIIKWPNDIYVEDKKVAGTLTEFTTTGQKIKSIIIGIGINVNNDHFPFEIPNAGSLKQFYGTEIHPKKLMQSICESIVKEIEVLNQNKLNIRKYYHSYLYKKDVLSRFRTETENFEGVISGVDDFGQIIILDKKTNSFRQFANKEVEFLF